MLTLSNALRICDINKDDIIKLNGEIKSVRNILETMDCKKYEVVKIKPWFSCGDYEGYKFTIKEIKR